MTARPVIAAAAAAALLTACTQEAAEPPVATPPSPQPTPAAAPSVGYACESGQTVTAQYPDPSTAQITYQGQTQILRLVQAASGARYAGNGLEWWTATRDGQESATLSRLGPNQDVGVAVLERCSRPTPAVGAPPVGPQAGPTPAPGGVLPASAPCKGPQLRLTRESGDAGAGNRTATLAVANLGAQPCSLTGYPTVALQDARGRGLTTVRSDQEPGSYFRAGEAPRPVELAANGRAFFDIAWNMVPNEGRGEAVCPQAARIRMTAPGDTAAVSLDQAFTPCGGRIRVSPFRPVADGTPPASPAAAAPRPTAKL